MSLSAFIVLLVAANALMLLASPIYRSRNRLLNWYYTNIFQKVFINKAYRSVLNWIVPLFYCSIIASFGLIYYLKLARITWSDGNHHDIPFINLSSFENYIFIPLMILSNLALVFICYKKSFTDANYKTLNTPQFDHILFHPNTICKTCQTVKQARSKHCSICEKCVPGFDHHCIWINCCVSQSNIFFFDLLLLNNLFDLLYVSIRAGVIITNFNASFLKYYKHVNVDKPEMLRIFKTVRKNLVTIFLLGMSFLLVMSWFVYAQLKLIMDGMSSNESDKWYVIHSLIYDGLVYKLNGKYYVITEDSKNDESLKKFNSVNFYDTRIYTFDNVSDRQRVTSPDEVENIYDKGSFTENLKERWSL